MTKSILLGLTSLVFSINLPAHDVQAPVSIKDFPFDHVSKHIHVIHGPLTRPSSDNRGFMNNPAAIVTRKGVIIIDPGSSVDIGRQLVEKISEITKNPVIAVFNTHVHGDHWLGNDGIRQMYPDVPIYAHQRMIERVNSGEGEFWAGVFKNMSKGATGNTKPVAPSIGLKGGETLSLDDVTIRIHYLGQAHSDNDIMIELVDDKTLFFGDVVVADHVPNSDVPQDASFKGSINAIETMLKGNSILFVPGHGHSGGREVPESTLRFLQKLTSLVKQYYDQDLQDYEMKDKILSEFSEYRNWHNFEEMGRVINYVYREIEKDNF